ncbi:hypothetical protein YC2023_055146 [Brassica napus]
MNDSVAFKGDSKMSLRIQALGLLFVFEAHREIAFFSSPQPENPEENSYVVAANQLARFPSAYGFSARQSLILPTLKSRKRFGVESYLGYEPIAKEFKVLSMECSCESGEWISAKHQVLTLGTNKLSWRFVECCIPHLSSSKWMCISGVLYYAAAAYSSYERTMVACFDLRSEKFSFVNFSRAMPSSTTLVNYNGKLGLLMSGDLGDFGDIAILDVAARNMCIAEMVGVNEIVLAPWFQNVPSYVIYFNVERKTITKVGIQGMEAFQGKRFDTYLNYVENVKLI